MAIKTVVDKCIEWNAARYDQVFDYDLAVKLLLEETEELFTAQDPITTLDAVGDIIFVSIGVLWKLGFTKEQITAMFYTHHLGEFNLTDTWHWSNAIQVQAFDVLDPKLSGAFPGVSLALYSIFVVAFGALVGMGMQSEFYAVVDAICESNNTKEIKGKTDPSVKANIVKGEGFIGPQATLVRIYTYHSERERTSAAVK